MAHLSRAMAAGALGLGGKKEKPVGEGEDVGGKGGDVKGREDVGGEERNAGGRR
ncbi:hypothetical protein [Sodalis sp. (in: enterobacteria)]|uniref:hypothetical protein n=1 Tax=Sodalis sp. (in: enterobacteria) TaxID=1898979 RepID=UPI003F2AE6CF